MAKVKPVMRMRESLRISLSIILLALAFGSGFAVVSHQSAKKDQDFAVFWKTFKTAVIAKDKRTVARLTKFPLVLAEGVPYVENSSEMHRRFDEVFNKETNAARCFTNQQPTADTEVSGRYTVSCPNIGDNFVVYEFDRTETGWKLIHRQFPSKCRCR
jgi:hypothetical protein